MANARNTTHSEVRGPGRSGGPRGGFQKPKNAGKTIRRLLHYVGTHPVMLAIAVFCVIASSLSSVAGTYVMRPIINSIAAAVSAGQADLPSLGRSVLKLFFLYLFAAGCYYLQALMMVQIAQRGCNALRKDLFDHLQTLPLSYFDQHPHGELMSRFTNDADNVQMALEQSVLQMVSATFTFLGILVMMLYLSRVLFLATLLMLVVTLLAFKTLGAAAVLITASSRLP